MEVPKFSFIYPHQWTNDETGEIEGYGVMSGGVRIGEYFPADQYAEYEEYIRPYRRHNAGIVAKAAACIMVAAGLPSGTVAWLATRDNNQAPVLESSAPQTPLESAQSAAEALKKHASQKLAEPSPTTSPSQSKIRIEKVHQPRKTVTVTPSPKVIQLPPKPQKTITAAPNPKDFGSCNAFKFNGKTGMVCFDTPDKTMQALKTQTRSYASMDQVLATISRLMGPSETQSISSRYALNTNVASADLRASLLSANDPTSEAVAADTVRVTNTLRAFKDKKVGIGVVNNMSGPMRQELTAKADPKFNIITGSPNAGTAILADRSEFEVLQTSTYDSKSYDGHSVQLPVAKLHVKGSESSADPAGKNVYVLSGQNPGDTIIYPNQAANRAAGIAAQQKEMLTLAQEGLPVIDAGTAGSDSEQYYQSMTATGLGVNAAETDSGDSSKVPKDLLPPQVTGTNNIAFSKYDMENSDSVGAPIVIAHAQVEVGNEVPTIPEAATPKPTAPALPETIPTPVAPIATQSVPSSESAPTPEAPVNVGVERTVFWGNFQGAGHRGNVAQRAKDAAILVHREQADVGTGSEVETTLGHQLQYMEAAFGDEYEFAHAPDDSRSTVFFKSSSYEKIGVKPFEIPYFNRNVTIYAILLKDKVSNARVAVIPYHNAVSDKAHGNNDSARFRARSIESDLVKDLQGAGYYVVAAGDDNGKATSNEETLTEKLIKNNGMQSPFGDTVSEIKHTKIDGHTMPIDQLVTSGPTTDYHDIRGSLVEASTDHHNYYSAKFTAPPASN